jgi:membrane-associated protease RseP (regulator of RpoE activity)
MNLKKAFYLVGSLVLTAGVVLAQQTAPAPQTPATPAMPGEAPMAFSMFIDGGSFLGVHAEDINKENMARYNMREPRGVGVTQVVKDSPAEKAGLRKDDVIVRFEGDSVTSVRKLTRLVSEVAPDQTVRLSISRGGADQEVSVTIAKRDNSMNAFRLEGFEGLKGIEGRLKGLDDKLKDLHKTLPPGANVWKWEGPGDGNFTFSFGNRRIGVSTTDLTKQLADYFGISDGKGVLVTSVADDSPAAKAGIKAGDIITSVDGEKIDGAGDLSRVINRKKDGDVTLTVVRNKNQRTFTVTPKESTPTVVPGSTPRVGRRVSIPRIELGTFPAVNITMPQIVLPVIPEINIDLGGPVVKPRVIRTRTTQPI